MLMWVCNHLKARRSRKVGSKVVRSHAWSVGSCALNMTADFSQGELWIEMSSGSYIFKI